MLEEMVKSVYNVPRKDTIKPRRGYKDRTVIVQIQCTIDPEIVRTESTLLWNAIVNWKQGGIKREHYTSGMLGDLVIQIASRVKHVLMQMEGKIQEVDIIFKMPSGKDHKLVATYKAALITE